MSDSVRKILVVEDDEVNLIIAKYILNKAGFNVTTVDNGESAIDIIAEQDFDLVLMDIEMPIMDGLEATPIIRKTEKGRKLPIIALTAHSLPEKLAQFKHAGIDDYILKPFDGDKFRHIADKYLPHSV
ncbi:MAG: response regulator [Bacteroidota bacterium]